MLRVCGTTTAVVWALARWWCPQRMFSATIRAAYVDRRGAVVHGAWEHATAGLVVAPAPRSALFFFFLGCSGRRYLPCWRWVYRCVSDWSCCAPFYLGVAVTAVVTVIRGGFWTVVVVAVDGRLAFIGLVLVAIGMKVMLRLLQPFGF